MLAIFGAVAAIAAAHPASAIAETVWAVGDGATATSTEDDALGAFIASKRPFSRLLYLGDVYETGTLDEFNTNYGGAFGAFKDISSPTPGDNEWEFERLAGYDAYWGGLAPRTSRGGHYYSFDVGGWHVISLDSNESRSSTSRQLAWLRADLAQQEYTGTCTIALIHEPGYYASATAQTDAGNGNEGVWAALDGHAVAVLSGNVHNYQRLSPQLGITQFIVGTGGRRKVAVANDAGGRVRSSTTATGALRLTLEPGSGRFDFFATDASTPSDSSTLTCRPHGSTPAPTPAPSPGSTPAPSPAPSPASTPAPSNQVPAGTIAPVASSSAAAGFATPIATTASTGRARISLRRPTGVTRTRGFTVVGRSQDARGAIRLSLVRRVGRRCQLFDGRRFRRSSCRARAVLTARGRGTWSYRFRGPLPRGTYLLAARAVDARGAITWTSRRLTVR